MDTDTSISMFYNEKAPERSFLSRSGTLSWLSCVPVSSNVNIFDEQPMFLLKVINNHIVLIFLTKSIHNSLLYLIF